MAEPLGKGLVVATYGRHCLVETADGERLICHPRGKKSQVLVGDRVQWQRSEDEGTVEKVEPRRNQFYRQDEIRTKAFAANLDQVLVLVAAEPEFSETQLTRALIAAEAERIAPLIVLNKRDLGALFERAWQRLAPYRAMGYTVLGLSLRGDAAQAHALLDQALRGRTTLVLGPSGAGKSSLINAMVPSAAVLTQEISQALQSGKHTTTSTTWYWTDASHSTALIDSPGFQEFGLHHVDAMQLASLMPDLRAHISGCKFYNCSHLHEPGCAIRAAVETPENPGAISVNRYKIYSDLWAELSAAPRY